MATIIVLLLSIYCCCLPVKSYPLSNDNQENNNSNDNVHHRTRSSIMNDEKNTDIIIISTGDDTSNLDSNSDNSMSSSSLNQIQSQFNDRRRDMFFEDYSVKQIQVVDTIANNSINGHGISMNINKYKSKKPSPPIHPNESPLFSSSSTIHNSQSTFVSTANSTTTTTTTTTTTEFSIELSVPLKPQRPNILLPKLEQSGRPSCLSTPDDTFCENVDNYPRNIIKQEVDFSMDQFAEIFGNKEIDGRTIMDVENDESICGKTPRVIYPKMAKNQANQWIYVVNEVEYTQAVVAEVCQRPGKPCAYMDSLPMGLSSMCKQKYSYKRLLALHPTEKRTYPDAFRFPSCCSCYIKSIDDFMARSNFRKIDKPITVIDNRSMIDDDDTTVLKSKSLSESLNTTTNDDTIIDKPSIMNITNDDKISSEISLQMTTMNTIESTVTELNNQTIN